MAAPDVPWSDWFHCWGPVDDVLAREATESSVQQADSTRIGAAASPWPPTQWPASPAPSHPHGSARHWYAIRWLTSAKHLFLTPSHSADGAASSTASPRLATQKPSVSNASTNNPPTSTHQPPYRPKDCSRYGTADGGPLYACEAVADPASSPLIPRHQCVAEPSNHRSSPHKWLMPECREHRRQRRIQSIGTWIRHHR